MHKQCKTVLRYYSITSYMDNKFVDFY